MPRFLTSLSIIAVATLAVAVFGGQTLRSTDTEAAVLTSGGYTTSAAVPPTSAGATASITASISAAAAGVRLVDIEVYSASGAKVHQEWFDNQAFSAGQTRTFTSVWQTQANTAAGAYSVRIGVFGNGWTAQYHWNGDAATLTIGGAGAATATVPVPTVPVPSGSLPALPIGWPSSNLEIGMADGAGGAAALDAKSNFAFRYQYLAGGVNTGNGWANWNANGDFVKYYIEDSVARGITPAFTYYMIYQSAPGNTQSETDGVYNNLNNQSTMQAYYADLKLFFQRAGAFPNSKVVFHVEPDLWGFMQHRATSDNAATVPVQVSATGMAELNGLPNTLAGFAQGLDRLRDQYAPNVFLGYHMSIWGTGNNIALSNPSDATVDQLATRAGNFYTSLGAGFDITFAEFNDRDFAFKQYQYGDGGATRYDDGDFARHARFMSKFVSVSQKRLVLWQIPLGNTKMRAMNNTWNHYQDNTVEWLLDEPLRSHLDAYRQGGVIALWFGRGADGATCACDANGDGVTNPAAINGNNLTSINSDDDGGFFEQKVDAYYAGGAMSLTGGSTPTPTVTPRPATATPTATPRPATVTPTATQAAASSTATRTATATATRTAVPATATRTATPAATSTAAPTQRVITSVGTTSSTLVRRGTSVRVHTYVTTNMATSALVDIEVYSPSGVKVFQKYFDNRSLPANNSRLFGATWSVPANAELGTYTLRVGVFAAGWGTMYHWNANGATFTVTN